MITCTFTVCPLPTNPVLGFTQYFFGAVVFTLNAISSAPLLVRRIVAGICFLSSTEGGMGGEGEGRQHRVFFLTERSRRGARVRPARGRRDARRNLISSSGCIRSPALILARRLLPTRGRGGTSLARRTRSFDTQTWSDPTNNGKYFNTGDFQRWAFRNHKAYKYS